MADHAPNTMMSPGPRRGRSPIFFVVLFLVGILGVAGGAIVVLFFVVGRGEAAAIVAIDASPVPSARAATRTTDAAPIVVPPPAHTATHATNAASSVAKSAGPAQLACLCHPNSGPTESLCGKERLGPSLCHCEATNGGYTLCPTPWSAAGCPTTGQFGGTITAKDGDPCSGFNGGTALDGSYTNEKLDGHLGACRPCTDVISFAGKIGAPCVGYRNERAPVNGTIDCQNLEMDCRHGDQAACAAYDARK